MWITDYNHFFSKIAFKNINPFILRFQIRKNFLGPLKIAFNLYVLL